MPVIWRGSVIRNALKVAMAHTALGDDAIGKLLHIAHFTFQDGDLQAVVMVDMHM